MLNRKPTLLRIEEIYRKPKSGTGEIKFSYLIKIKMKATSGPNATLDRPMFLDLEVEEVLDLIDTLLRLNNNI